MRNPKTPDVEEFRKLFRLAPRSPGPGTFSLRPVTGNLHLSRLPDGEASMVLQLEARPGQRAVEFGALRLEVFPDAELRLGRKKESSAIGILTCTDEAFVHQFLILAADMCSTISRDAQALATAARFTAFVDDWAEVFARVRGMTPEEELGLWGELEVLARLPVGPDTIECWHGPEAAPFDFAGDRVYLEVKTSLGGHKHHFGLEQVSSPTKSSEVFVASLHVVEDPAAGLSLDDQVARVRARHGSDVTLDRKLAKLRYRPGGGRARFSLLEIRFLEGDRIPRPRRIDKGVSGVRFVADLGALSPMQTRQIKSLLARTGSRKSAHHGSPP